MKFRSKAPVEQDFVNDLEGATQAEEGMGLHHEKILSLLHTLNIIPLADKLTHQQQLNSSMLMVKL